MLTFETLRDANRARLLLYKNAKGELEDCADWSLNDWMTAVMGELGEAANVLKKVRRGDMSLDEARAKVAEEIADVICYLDILADKAGINMSEAVLEKWNTVSKRIECPLRLRTWTYSEGNAYLWRGEP